MFVIFYYLYTKYNLYNKNKVIEKFDTNENNTIVLFNIFLNLLISFYALYLSINCRWNKKETDVFSKIFFGLFAFLLGFLYLIYYFFINYIGGKCS